MAAEDLLAGNVKHLLPQLTSFAFEIADEWPMSNVELVNAIIARFMREMPMPAVSGLRRLTLPERAFHEPQTVANSCGARRALASLSILDLSEDGEWRGAGASRLYVLRLVSTCFVGLSTLSVIVDGELQPYLPVFRALTGLTTLGLRVHRLESNIVPFGQGEAIVSVLDLRIRKRRTVQISRVLALVSLFPRVKSIAFACPLEGLRMASTFCTEQVLPNVEELSCFNVQPFASFASARLIKFLTIPYLPGVVDLSSTPFVKLAMDASLLTDIYHAMQASSISSLRLRGPVNRDALAHLRSSVNLDKNTNIRVWTDRDLGEQLDIVDDNGKQVETIVAASEFCPATDIEIVATKTSGVLKGAKFTIRVVHQLSKRPSFFA